MPVYERFTPANDEHAGHSSHDQNPPKRVPPAGRPAEELPAIFHDIGEKRRITEDDTERARATDDIAVAETREI